MEVTINKMGIKELVWSWEEDEEDDSINSVEILEIEVWCNLFSRESNFKDKQLIFSVIMFKWWVKLVEFIISWLGDEEIWLIFVGLWIYDEDEIVFCKYWRIDWNGRSSDHICFTKEIWNGLLESLNK